MCELASSVSAVLSGTKQWLPISKLKPSDADMSTQTHSPAISSSVLRVTSETLSDTAVRDPHNLLSQH
jgi:hypothetical protein